MKKLFHSLIFLFLLSPFLVKSQSITGQKPERTVPIIVSAAFNSQFPQQDPVWFSRYQGRFDQQLVYEARFIIDNRYSSAFFDKEGGFIAFAFTIDHKEIPNEIHQYMKKKYPDFPILDAILVTGSKNGKTYELGIVIDGEYVIKVFSEEGEFIKSTRA